MHATNLAALDRVDEVLLFDPVPGRAAQASAELSGTKAVDDLDTLLGNVDGVLLATPTDTHPEMLRAAIGRGVPTLCEKPIASDLAAMTALVEDVEKSGVEVLVGFQRRFDPAIYELNRRIRAGEVGDIYLVRAVGNDANPPDFSYLPASGGIFRDLLIHDLDCVPWLVGEPVVEVYASGSVLVHQAFADADDVDNAVVMLKFAGGASGCLTAVFVTGDYWRVQALGSKGWLEIRSETELIARGLEGAPQTVKLPAVDKERAELEAFADAVAAKQLFTVPPAQIINGVAVIESIEKSSASGSPIQVR